MVKAIVVSGFGINCEKEMAKAIEFAGGNPSIVHANFLINKKIDIEKYSLILLPGGFSFGDDLGAGLALANRLKYAAFLKERLQTYVDHGGCILGICNGFQLLVKLGLLPGNEEKKVSLAINNSLKFENRWSYHKVYSSPCIFTQNLEKLYLPIRHAEGKFVVNNRNTHQKLIENRQIVFRYSDSNYKPTDSYPYNPNGSFDNIAGICDKTGRILGMMAHPEAFFLFRQSPFWIREKEILKRSGQKIPEEGEGFQIFKNAISYIKENL